MKTQSSFRSSNSSGSLFLVPTPIGNLEDMTFRAINCLKESDLIAAEDTRNTRKLLNHFDIHTPMESFHEHNVREKIPELINYLKEGKSIAQVSDAGMPSISDPGHELVLAVIEEDIPVISLPGASAGITALIASGLAPQPHTFYGFLARKKTEQVRFFESRKADLGTQIFYESPLRVAKTLNNMLEVYKDREIVVVRELTKIYEEYRRGKITEILEDLENHPLKGECLILVSEASEVLEEYEDTALEAIKKLISQGEKTNVAIKTIAKARQLNRQELYHQFHDIKD